MNLPSASSTASSSVWRSTSQYRTPRRDRMPVILLDGSWRRNSPPVAVDGLDLDPPRRLRHHDAVAHRLALRHLVIHRLDGQRQRVRIGGGVGLWRLRHLRRRRTVVGARPGRDHLHRVCGAVGEARDRVARGRTRGDRGLPVGVVVLATRLSTAPCSPWRCPPPSSSPPAAHCPHRPSPPSPARCRCHAPSPPRRRS